MIAAIEVIIKYKNRDYMQMMISKYATTLSLKTIISQTKKFIPSTIELWYDDKLLDDHQIVHSILKDGNNFLTLEAVLFPIDTLGSDINFAENVGIKIFPDCAICLEKNNSTCVYKCGHGNVCSVCQVKYQQQNCPVCINIDK